MPGRSFRVRRLPDECPFKRTFLFTGGEIVGEFLISTGYLPGAHHPGCPVYQTVLARRPPWTVPPGRGHSGQHARHIPNPETA